LRLIVDLPQGHFNRRAQRLRQRLVQDGVNNSTQRQRLATMLSDGPTAE
jgi:hypothetical protein